MCHTSNYIFFDYHLDHTYSPIQLSWYMAKSTWTLVFFNDIHQEVKTVREMLSLSVLFRLNESFFFFGFKPINPSFRHLWCEKVWEPVLQRGLIHLQLPYWHPGVIVCNICSTTDVVCRLRVIKKWTKYKYLLSLREDKMLMFGKSVAYWWIIH